MAKLPTKKPKLTPEEQLAELAALTGDVAAINLMHPNAPVATPASTTPAVATSVSTPKPEAPAVATASATTSSAASAPPAAAETVTSASLPADRVGEGQPEGKSEPVSAPTPKPTPQSAADITTSAPATGAVADPIAESTLAEETPDEEVIGSVAVSTPATGTGYTLDALFEPSKEKKTVMMRITPALHQYFQHIGLLLGDGASVPDVVHNILMEWKSAHEKEVQKALQKQMRLMLKNAS